MYTGKTCHWAHDPEFKGRADITPICPHMDDTGQCPLKNCYFRHPPNSLPETLPAILPAKERAAVASHDHLADDMAEIKTKLYGVIKEQAEQRITINEQKGLITDQKVIKKRLSLPRRGLALPMCLNFLIMPMGPHDHVN